MSDSEPVKPETGRRFRRAAAFLLHWHDKDSISAKGVVEILNEAGTGAGEGNWQETDGFICAVAELAWNMAKIPDPESAGEYLRAVARHAAMDKVMGGTR